MIESYIKLKRQECDDFIANNEFEKDSPITEWEKINTLDC